jgi:hypothetical protein
MLHAANKGVCTAVGAGHRGMEGRRGGWGRHAECTTSQQLRCGSPICLTVQESADVLLHGWSMGVTLGQGHPRHVERRGGQRDAAHMA